MSCDDENILHGPTPLYEPAKGGVGYEIFRSLNLNKGKTAQCLINTGETVSYDDLLLRSVRTAIFLSKKNLRKEDIVCLCSGNEVNSMVPYIAAKFVGVTYASIEPTLPEDDLVYLLTYLQPKILFVTENAETKVEACLEKSNVKCDIINLGHSVNHISFSEVLLPAEEEETFQPVFIEDLKETAVIFLSSGTTGKPKGICCNHYALLAQPFIVFSYFHPKGTMNLSNFQYKFDDSDSMKLMFYAPLYWVSGHLMALGVLFSGATMLLGSSFDAKGAWEAIEKHKPGYVFLPPGQVNELCSYMTDKKPNTFVDIFVTGGGLVSKSHLESIWRCFPHAKVIQSYGSTENSGLLSTFNVGEPRDMDLQRMHPDSCGKTTVGIEIKIVNLDNGKSCGPRMQGELRAKNRYIMNGFYKMDSSSAFDEDGWFKTGDLAFFDENGCIFIVDRLKDVLLYKLFNIRPSIIDNILCQHPAVHECFVIGLPHPTDNEHPMAVVKLRENYRNKVDEDEIVSFVNQRVPSDRYKIRAGVKFVDEMIKTPTGKLKKLEMKNLIIKGQL